MARIIRTRTTRARPSSERFNGHEWVPMFGDPATDWTRWFAWRPVETWDRRWRWLCWVERRLIVKHHFLDGGGDCWWQHRVWKPDTLEG